MTYAIQLTLGRRDLAKLKVKDDYSVHRVIFSLFEDVRSEEDKQNGSSGFVFADLGGNALARRFIIVSDRPPMEVELEAGSSLEAKKIPETFYTSDLYRFRILICPTKRNSKTGKLECIRTREEISNWFVSRSAGWGFEVCPGLTVDKNNGRQFRGKSERNINISQAEISGVLRVTDREAFKKSVEHGIGRGRAWGLGLLQVVPLVI